MEWILNDLSLEKKYNTSTEFLDDIVDLLKLLLSNPALSRSFFCPRNIGNIEVINGRKFSQVVLSDAPRDLKQQIMSWVSKNGPFWSDQRTNNEDDYFEYNQIDVTDLGLGECARKTIVREHVSSYSFSGVYNLSPLPIQHGIDGDILGLHEVTNLWTTEKLIESEQNARPIPTSWFEAIEQFSLMYPKLIYPDSLLTQISCLPFNLTVLNRMKELSRVLSDYLASRTPEGNLTHKSHEILQQYFHGDKAWFSDETDKDVAKFEHQLKFIDVRDNKKKLYRYHGKIKTPQVRVYFEWPITPDQDDIQIVYFGPKITIQ
jgi:hypothetical protein